MQRRGDKYKEYRQEIEDSPNLEKLEKVVLKEREIEEMNDSTPKKEMKEQTIYEYLRHRRRINLIIYIFISLLIIVIIVLVVVFGVLALNG